MCRITPISTNSKSPLRDPTRSIDRHLTQCSVGLIDVAKLTKDRADKDPTTSIDTLITQCSVGLIDIAKPTKDKAGKDPTTSMDTHITQCSVSLIDIAKPTKDRAEKIYPCPHCHLVFMKVKKLVLHKREKHKKEFFDDRWQEKVKQHKAERKRESTYDVEKSPGQTWKRNIICQYCKNKPRTGLFMIHQNRCRKQRADSNSCTGDCLNGEHQYDCPYCGNWYINGNLLKAHVKLLHSRPDKVKDTKRRCKQCGKTFLSIKYLTYHTELAHREIPMESSEDNMEEVDVEEECLEMLTENEVRAHDIDEEPDVENGAEVIPASDNAAEDLKVGTRPVSDSEIEVPKQRRKSQKLYSSLSSSLDESVDRFVKTYECMDCGGTFKTVTELYVHYMQKPRIKLQAIWSDIQRTEGAPVVETCNFVDSSTSDTEPSSILHDEKDSCTQVTKIKQTTDYEGLLASYMMNYVECEMCDQSFYTEAGLKVHKFYAHRSSSTSISCSKCCDCSTSTTSKLCSKCSGWSTSCDCTLSVPESSGELRIQKNNDEESREFQCKLCDDAFYTEGGLKIHTQNAHRQKDFKATPYENVREPTADLSADSNTTLWQPSRLIRTQQQRPKDTKPRKSPRRIKIKQERMENSKPKQEITKRTKSKQQERMENAKPKYQCEKCKQQFPTLNFLNAHKIKCVPEPENSTTCSCTCTGSTSICSSCTCTTCTSGEGSTCRCSTCRTTTSCETSDENKSFTESIKRTDNDPSTNLIERILKQSQPMEKEDGIPEEAIGESNVVREDGTRSITLTEVETRSAQITESGAGSFGATEIGMKSAVSPTTEVPPMKCDIFETLTAETVGNKVTSDKIHEDIADGDTSKCSDCDDEKVFNESMLRIHPLVWHDEVNEGHSRSKEDSTAQARDLNKKEVIMKDGYENSKPKEVSTRMAQHTCENKLDILRDQDEAASDTKLIPHKKDQFDVSRETDHENDEKGLRIQNGQDNTGLEEVIHKGQDVDQSKEDQVIDDKVKTSEQMGSPDLLLGPGFTVEVASHSSNESLCSQKLSDQSNRDKTALDDRKTPEMQFLCVLCGGYISLLQGHDTVYRHAIEKHNGVIEGKFTTWITELDEKNNTAEYKAKKKRKRSKYVRKGKENLSKVNTSKDAFEASNCVNDVSPQSTGEKVKKKAKNKIDGNLQKVGDTLKECDKNDAHNQNELTDSPRKCDQCNTKFKTEALLKNHRISVDGKLFCREVNSILFKCEPCKRLFLSESMLGRHRKSCPKNLKCYLCDVMCRNQAEVRSHLQAEHSEYVLGKKGKPKTVSFPQCDVCGKSFLAKQNLKLHKAASHKDPVIDDVTESKADGEKEPMVKFSPIVEHIQDDDNDNDMLTNLVIPRKAMSKEEKAKLKDEEAEKDVLKTQHFVGNLVQECYPTLRSLSAVRDTSENRVVNKIEYVDSVEVTNGSEIRNATPPKKVYPPLPLVPGGYPICLPNPPVVNDDGGQVPHTVEGEPSPVQDVPNLKSTDERMETGERDDQGEEIVNGKAKKSRKRRRKKKKTPIQDNVLTNLVGSVDSMSFDSKENTPEVLSNSDKSLSEYKERIAWLAHHHDEKLKEPLDKMNFTIVGSNLLPMSPSGEIYGTVTDQILMLLQTSYMEGTVQGDSGEEQTSGNRHKVVTKNQEIDRTGRSISKDHSADDTGQSTDAVQQEVSHGERSNELKATVDDILGHILEAVFNEKPTDDKKRQEEGQEDMANSRTMDPVERVDGITGKWCTIT